MEIVVHVEEDDGAVLEFGADDPLGRQPHPVAIESQRLFQVPDGQSENFDS